MAVPNLFEFLTKRRSTQSSDDAYQLDQQQPRTVATKQYELPKIDSENVIGSLSGILGPSPEERAAEEQRLQEHRQKQKEKGRNQQDDYNPFHYLFHRRRYAMIDSLLCKVNDFFLIMHKRRSKKSRTVQLFRIFCYFPPQSVIGEGCHDIYRHFTDRVNKFYSPGEERNTSVGI